MATSAVAIGNMALGHVASRVTIESFTEQSAEAGQVNLWYDISRLQTLEAFNWNFARRRQALALHSDDPPLALWSFRYSVPSDVVVMREIENPLGKTADAIPFQIEQNASGTGKTLLTNAEDAVAVYTFDLEDPSMFSPHFIQMLSLKLGSNIAFSMSGKRQMRIDLLQWYNALLLEAPAYNFNEEVSDPPREAESIRGRV